MRGGVAAVVGDDLDLVVNLDGTAELHHAQGVHLLAGGVVDASLRQNGADSRGEDQNAAVIRRRDVEIGSIPGKSRGSLGGVGSALLQVGIKEAGCIGERVRQQIGLAED